MRKALVARGGLAKRDAELKATNGVPGPDDVVAFESAGKSDNPWEYPAEAREAMLAPARAAKLTPPILCSVPLIDAIYMTAPGGIVIPLANYTLQPIPEMTLEIALEKTGARSAFGSRRRLEVRETRRACNLRPPAARLHRLPDDSLICDVRVLAGKAKVARLEKVAPLLSVFSCHDKRKQAIILAMTSEISLLKPRLALSQLQEVLISAAAPSDGSIYLINYD